MKSRIKVTMVALVLILITTVGVYADNGKKTGTEMKIEYNTKAYEEYWDSILEGITGYDELVDIARETEVINSIMELEDEEKIEAELEKFDVLKKEKSDGYWKEVTMEKEKEDKVNRTMYELIRIVLGIAAVVFLMLAAKDWDSRGDYSGGGMQFDVSVILAIVFAIGYAILTFL